jgi:hypothetical protein
MAKEIFLVYAPVNPITDDEGEVEVVGVFTKADDAREFGKKTCPNRGWSNSGFDVKPAILFESHADYDQYYLEKARRSALSKIKSLNLTETERIAIGVE